jgi:uncharacterized protein YlxP (DUF503 family)
MPDSVYAAFPVNMIIGACRLELYLPDAASLKDKRSVLKSLLTRLHNTHNVAVAELEYQDIWQSAVIGIVTVSNSTAHADQMLTRVTQWIEDNFPQLMIVKQTTEIIT